MAEKRMFSNKVIGSDAFLEMPDSTQNLYFHLSMYADDEGFVDKPKSIMRMTGKKEDDLKLLIAKSFIIPFDSGVIVIKHWRLNNYLRGDRFHETIYKEELSRLTVNDKNEYEFSEDTTLGIPTGIPTDNLDILNYSNIISNNNINNLNNTKTKNAEKKRGVDDYDFAEDVKNAILLWLQYKKEKGQTYKPTGLQTLLDKLKKQCDTEGNLSVIDDINFSMTQNYQGIFKNKNNNYKTTPQPSVSKPKNSRYTEADIRALEED